MAANNLKSYSIYRFQIVPISTVIQTHLFDEIIDYGELIERKNKILSDIISEPNTQFRGRGYDALTKIEFNNGEDIVMKVGRERRVELHSEDFTTQTYPDYPNVNVYIDNRPTRQFTLIENNLTAFSDSDAVANIIEKALNPRLRKFNLVIYIERTFNEGEFWNTISEYDGLITSMRFEFIKPNMANISGAIKRTFDKLESTTNSHKTTLTLQAPAKGVLEGTTPSNEVLSDVVNYQAQGGGPPPTIKIRGYKKKIKTSMSERTISLGEYEGNTEGFIEAIKQIEDAF